MRSFFLLLAVFAIGSAFTVGPSAMRSSSRSSFSSATRLSLMTAEESRALLTYASDCVEGECSLDQVGDLITVLKKQQKDLSTRIEELKATVARLEQVNTDGSTRQTDEVRETVRAIVRLFLMGAKASGNDYPALSKPSGYSGDVGDGPKTAWDALPPKKWSSSKKA